MKTGVHDISIEDYHQGAGFSRSKLISFMKSPLHFWHEAFNEDKPEYKPPEISKKINPLEFGNALHTYVLEPDLFEKSYFVIPKLNRVRKADKELYKELVIEAEGRELLCEEAFSVIKQMTHSVLSNPDSKGMIEGAEYEKSIYWTDPATKILCKVRPDIWHSNMIVDLKTTVDASYFPFQRSVYKFAYHIQAGMIQQALKHALGIDMKNFLFLAVEKEPPYASCVYLLDEDAVSMGVAAFKNILVGVQDCLEKDEWPSYPIGKITAPKWAKLGNGD